MIKQIYLLLILLIFGASFSHANEKELFRTVQTKALAGDSSSIMEVGRRYSKGIDVKKDEEEALRWYNMALSKNYVPAFKFFGDAYYSGNELKSIEKDYNKAYQNYFKAAKDDEQARYMIAYMAFHGIGVDKNYNIAFENFSSTCPSNIYSCVYLGIMYRYGVLGKKDYDKGNYYFKFLELEPFNDVASTDAEAYFNRGRRLIYKNPDNAIDVLLNAKELGLKEAGDIVNIVILNDNKAYKTSTKGFEVLKNFAESGNVNAMNMLGEIYKDGKIVKKDIEQSKKWLKEATDKGDVIASRNLGLLYLDEGDSITALRWFTNSAEGKDAVSAYYVAQIYGTNEILKDEKQSEEWFLKAAELGNFKAMAVAGAMYVNGTKFVSKDYAKAYAWLYLASNGFVGLEKQKLIEKSLVIKTHLSEQELEKANEYIIKYQK